MSASSPRPSAASRSTTGAAQRLDVGVEGVDHHAEGQLLLELGGPALQHQAAAALGPPDELGQHVGLADPRLAAEEDGLGPPAARRAQHDVEAAELLVPTDEQFSAVPHLTPRWEPTPIGATPGRALHDPSHLDAGRHVELAEDVAHVGLDRLEAEEEVGGDLGVGAPVDHPLGHLELPGAQGVQTVALGGSRSGLPASTRWPSLRSSWSTWSR